MQQLAEVVTAIQQCLKSTNSASQAVWLRLIVLEVSSYLRCSKLFELRVR